MTLSDITGETRTLLKWLGLIIAALIVFLFLMKIKDAVFPAAPPPPKVGFGKLPAIEFPANVLTKNLNYSINTITGTLPAFSSSEKVYKLEKDKPDLLSLSRAKEKARGIGFEKDPAQVSENVYQWKDENGKILTMNILNFNFNVSSDYLLNNNIPNFKNRADLAVSVAKDFLGRMSFLPKDLDDSKTTTDLFFIKNFKLVPSTSLSNAQVVRVNFFQKDFNNLPIFYPNPTSPLNFTIGGTPDPDVLEANFSYQKLSDVFSTYPLKSADKAYEDLKKGDAYISVQPQAASVSIKKVTLGYYVGEKEQNFLMPIIVFEGDNFRAYVSAVTDEWVNK